MIIHEKNTCQSISILNVGFLFTLSSYTVINTIKTIFNIDRQTVFSLTISFDVVGYVGKAGKAGKASGIQQATNKR